MANLVRIPASAPADLLELVSFWRTMDAQMRRMRETTSLPRAAVTLPDEFDAVVADIWERVHRQAKEGLNAGEEAIEVILPLTDDMRALAAWGHKRWELLEGLIRAGMVQSQWSRPLSLMLVFWKATLEQIP